MVFDETKDSLQASLGISEEREEELKVQLAAKVQPIIAGQLVDCERRGWTTPQVYKAVADIPQTMEEAFFVGASVAAIMERAKMVAGDVRVLTKQLAPMLRRNFGEA